MQFGENSELLCIVSGISWIALGASCHCEAALRSFFLSAPFPSECARVPLVLREALQLKESNGDGNESRCLGQDGGGVACCGTQPAVLPLVATSELIQVVPASGRLPWCSLAPGSAWPPVEQGRDS